MEDAMVTGRMPAGKKAAGNAVLRRAGLNASQAVNALYDRLIEEQNADFLVEPAIVPEAWAAAAKFVDSLVPAAPVETRFDRMGRGEIKLARAQAKGRA